MPNPNITLVLTNEEAKLLDRHVRRRVDELERELVRTDSPSMQHELSIEWRRLHDLSERIGTLVTEPRRAA